MEEQKALCDKMNGLLKSHLNPSSKSSCKNLVAAIATSKKPGFFEYYSPSDDVKNIESTGMLKTLTKQISKVHAEIEAINEEIDNARAAKRAADLGISQVPMDSMSSLSAWFETYGKPKTFDSDQMRDKKTKFEPAKKIYGGTSHHKSFKSKAMTMRKGRLV